MAENYTLYAEVDPNSHISPAASIITLSGLARNEDAYLYRDFGADAWNGNFTVDFDFNVDAAAQNGGICEALFLTNLVDDVNSASHTNFLSARVYSNTAGSSSVFLYLYERYSSTNYIAQMVTLDVLAFQTTYYARVKRVGTAFTYKVYASSANRAAETSELASISLTLHDTLAFRYFFPTCTYNSGHTLAFSGTLSNHNIVTGPSNIISVSDTGAGADSVNMIQNKSVSDTGAGADAVNIAARFMAILEEALGTDAIVLDDGTTRITITDSCAGADSASIAVKYLLVADTAAGTDTPVISLRLLTVTDSGTGAEVVAAVSNNSLQFGVVGFPSGQTVEYRIKDQNGTLVQDWTSTGVIEDVEITGKSTYTIKGIMLANGFQGKISWKIPGTTYYAVEIINYYESWISTYASLPTLSEIEGSTVLAKEATVASRLASASYTAPDNAGIASILSLIQGFDKWKNNKLKRTAVNGSVETWVLYDDDGNTPMLTWTHDTATMTRNKAT